MLSKFGNRIKAVFALDTGMNRIGLDADDPDLCEKIIRSYIKKLSVLGIFTHLCVADTDSSEAIAFTNLNTLPKGIKPALSWYSVVSMVKTVEAGETIGYEIVCNISKRVERKYKRQIL